jgi:hypothetical protein
MANSSISSRGTSWEIIVTHPGFRTGFRHVRESLGWEPVTEQHGREWWWWYEMGRLFAASLYSRRWNAMPSERRKVSPTLLKALRSAQFGSVFPRTDGEWRQAA